MMVIVVCGGTSKKDRKSLSKPAQLEISWPAGFWDGWAPLLLSWEKVIAGSGQRNSTGNPSKHKKDDVYHGYFADENRCF